MRNIIKLSSILTLVTAIAALALAGVNTITKPLIEEQMRLAVHNALLEVLPEASGGVCVDVGEKKGELFEAYSSPDTTGLAGFAFKAYGKGYSSTIETMVGLDLNGNIKGIKILFQQETPGLGSKIEEIKYGKSKPWFQEQFKNKNAERVAVDKDDGEIKSITGATISSRAVTNSIRNGFKKIKPRLEKIIKGEQK
ncbi:hypothetical protein DRQ09_04890 [candidate division KSB1 bacterium]|nr:MAG: hypothetical protein DRQ09_04890 [candidate division KSB1 bacterium]